MAAEAVSIAPPDRDARTREARLLEDAHHEICTVITIARNHLALAARTLERDPPRHLVVVEEHLQQATDSMQRLSALAKTLRRRHEEVVLGDPAAAE